MTIVVIVQNGALVSLGFVAVLCICLRWLERQK